MPRATVLEVHEYQLGIENRSQYYFKATQVSFPCEPQQRVHAFVNKQLSNPMSCFRKAEEQLKKKEAENVAMFFEIQALQ